MWRRCRSRPANACSLFRQTAGCCAARSCRRCGAETPHAPARAEHRPLRPPRSPGAGAAAPIAVIAQARRVLNYQQVPPFHQPSGAGMCGCYHLARHAWIMQEPPGRISPARSPPSGRTRTPSLADRNKTVQTERPPFPSDGRQTAPACVPFRFLRHALTARKSETAPRRKAGTARRCVHVAGARPGIMGLSVARDFALSPSRASQSNGTI